VEFVTLIAVEDEYSRAMQGKQTCKGSRQSVPDWRFEWRFRHIAFFILVFAGKNKDKGKDREKA
jgi:hypothetical protein